MKTKGCRAMSVLLAIVFLLSTIQLGALATETALESESATAATYTGWAEESGDVNVKFLYLRNGTTDQTTVAYCGDHSRDWPAKYGEPYAETKIIENENVRAVLYNGYPTNGGGLMETFGLTEDRFRAVTQWVVWACLDDYDMTAWLSFIKISGRERLL
jgi:TQXA domain-containing protein